MKRFTAVLIGLLCLPAYAEIAPVDYWDQPEEAEVQVTDEVVAQPEEETPVKQVSQPAMVSPRATIGRSATRTMSSANGTTSTRAVAAPSRAVASRNSSASIRSMMNPNSGTVASRQSSSSNVNEARVGTSSPLYNSTNARVAIRNSAGVGTRVATVTSGLTTTSSSSTTSGTDMEELAQMTDFCKAQYFSCMDNFCNTLDDNEGRCSCSANIKNYQKVEDALKTATEDLQNVAMQIQYLGLNKDEVVALFSQTEAEEAMSENQDTTDLKNDLDKYENLLLILSQPAARDQAMRLIWIFLILILR